MELPQLAIFVICLIGCGSSCWSIGHSEGISDTIDWLASQGVIALEEENDA
jgi:hypothetical protein